MHIHIAVTFFIVVFVVLTPNESSAALFELKKPRLPMAKSFTESDYVKLNEVLDGKGIKDVKYIKGHWLNLFSSLQYYFFSSLQYRGDTCAVNHFIEALTKCPKVAVHVTFERPSPGVAEYDWMVTHTANKNKLIVRINLKSKSIDLTKLHLPTFQPKKPATTR